MLAQPMGDMRRTVLLSPSVTYTVPFGAAATLVRSSKRGRPTGPSRLPYYSSHPAEVLTMLMSGK